jgi:hypothetical protein
MSDEKEKASAVEKKGELSEEEMKKVSGGISSEPVYNHPISLDNPLGGTLNPLTPGRLPLAGK